MVFSEYVQYITDGPIILCRLFYASKQGGERRLNSANFLDIVKYNCYIKNVSILAEHMINMFAERVAGCAVGRYTDVHRMGKYVISK